MTERNYTTEEMALLARHEDNLHRAYYSQWCKAMSHYELRMIYDIHVNATGWNLFFNPTCGSCTLTLLTAVGGKYFAQKEAQPMDIAEPIQQKGLTPANEEPKHNVSVKTRKSKK